MALTLNHRLALDLLSRLKCQAGRASYINWAVADQVIVSGVSFLTTILVARFLGIEEFGRFALAWLGVFFAQNFQLALVIQPMMTIARKQPRKEISAYTGSVILHQVVLSLLAVVFVYAGVSAAEMIRPEWQLGQLAIPISLLVLTGQYADFVRRFFFTFDRPSVAFLVDLTRYGAQAVSLAVMFIFFREFASVATALYVISTSSLLALLVAIPVFGPFRFEMSNMQNTGLRHWKFARWLIPSAVATWCRENFVHTAVAAVLGLSDLGALRAAQQLVRMVNVLIQAFENIVPMRAGAAFAGKGFAGLVDFIDVFILRYSAVIALVLAAIALVGGKLLTLVYGAEFSNYGQYVAAYAAVMVLYLVRNSFAMVLRAMERTVFEFFASVSGAAIITLLALPLVTAFGMAGAFISLAIFECVMLLCLSFGFSARRVARM